MVVLVRFHGVWLFFFVLSVSPCAWAAGASVPPYLRTALDAASLPLEPREPRRIRSTLDDPSQASFPLDGEGRLIRVSLDEGLESYGHLNAAPARARRVRTQLD